MRTLPVFLLLFLTICAPLLACLWDRDTFAMEAKGRLEVVETAVGWFDRFPSEYYQMRLERVTPEITAHPDRLDLYDDAAVACDRLGRHEEAVTWMEKKDRALQSLPAEKTKDDRYRLHANLGVFHTHLWLKSGDRTQHSSILEQAIQEVKTALEINPNAHFGRERAHLLLLEWWKDGLDTSAPGNKEAEELFFNACIAFASITKRHPQADLVKGLCGLIQMGSAQESVDVHALLASQFLPAGQRAELVHHSLCHLSSLRVAELVVGNKEPVHPILESWAELELAEIGPLRIKETRIKAVDELGRDLPTYMHMWGPGHGIAVINHYFHEARTAAIQRHEAKTAFMLAQFKQGRHPDTHADFWNGWQEPVMPPIPPQSPWEKRAGLTLGGWITRNEDSILLWSIIVGGMLIFFFVKWIDRRWIRRHSKATTSS